MNKFSVGDLVYFSREYETGEEPDSQYCYIDQSTVGMITWNNEDWVHVVTKEYPGGITVYGSDVLVKLEDWHRDSYGYACSSSAFERIANRVDDLIKDNASSMLSGNVGSVVRIILADLITKSGIVPLEEL